MSDWVLTADRKPTADDADTNEHYPGMVQCQNQHGTLRNVHYKLVAESSCLAWRSLPEPYKPPVPERWERFVVVTESGAINGAFPSYEDASRRLRDLPSGAYRIAHIREVRNGDPTPEDVSAAIGLMQLVRDYGACRASVDKAIELLGGKP